MLRGLFHGIAAGTVFLAFGICASGLSGGGAARAQDVTASDVWSPVDGSITLHFDANVLDSLGWQIASTGSIDGSTVDAGLSFEILPSAAFTVQRLGSDVSPLVAGRVNTRGALRLGARGSLLPIGNLVIVADGDRSWSLSNSSETKEKATPIFDISSAVVRASDDANVIYMSGNLSVGRSWALRLGLPDAGGAVIGTVDVVIRLGSVEQFESGVDGLVDQGEAGHGSATTVQELPAGPDVIVGDLHEVNNYGSVGDISAFSVGTTSCNIGKEELDWFSDTNEHPVIGQNMFRLKDGRFEQIGQSWLKHGFFALSGTLCSGEGGCEGDQTGKHLGVGCSDPYSANLNGQMFNLGPRSQVNASTGDYPFPFTAPNPSATIGRRLQVHNEDLEPALNSGAQYFVEGQYVTPDDSAAGNNNNNNSYRPIAVVGSGGSFGIVLFGTTQREQPAIRAWKAADPEVFEIGVNVPNDGLFIVAARATPVAPQLWHYEYAVHNVTSHQSGRAFEVPISPFATVSNVGFHDVDYHSGEPYDGTDWESTAAGGKVAWSTETFAANSDANALRWGTLYNFRFDSNAPPQQTEVTLKLFRSGVLSEVTVDSIGPLVLPSDCDVNGIDDLCDVACGEKGGVCFVNGCGGGADCGGDGILDECEPDCNNNDTADSCDILAGIASDCDNNGILDECEFEDCNENTIADVCDIESGVATDCAGGPIGIKSAGQSLYNPNCSSCHGFSGNGSIAPAIREKTRAELRLALIAPTRHPLDSLPILGEQDFADLEAFLTSEGSRGRPDRIPDSCQTPPDCGGADESDACELENGSQVDVDYDGLPDSCLRVGPPVPDLIAKNRYIAFLPSTTTQAGVGPVSQAFRLVSPDFPLLLKWVGPPGKDQISRLQCVEHYQDWGSSIIYVADADIVPAATYSVQALQEGVDVSAEFLYSQPPIAIATHHLWGDVAGDVDAITLEWTPPNSLRNVNDVVALIHNFGERPNAPHFSWVDIAGEVPNGFVNVSDVQHVLLAFKNGPYPFSTPSPCP